MRQTRLRRRPQRPILGQNRRRDVGGVAAAGDLGPGAGGRAGTPPAEATMPLAALQAARGAPLAGLPHAPEGREGREAGSVTRGHGRCGPRRARARDSP